MADVYQNEIGKLFDQSVFDIPKYQRGYSWTPQEINDFISDLEYTYEEKNTKQRTDFSHYFGTIVLLDKGKEDAGTKVFDLYDIIDGQQRMTTVSMFMSCLNSELNYISEFGTLSQDYSMSPAETAAENNKSFVSYHGSERITLDSLNNNVYQSITIYDDSTDNINPQNIAQRRLVESKETIQDWFETKRNEHVEDGMYDRYYDYLRELGKIVKNGLEVTTYVIEDETEAGRLFEVVNDRGKDLTKLDRIKSYLVYCASRLDDPDLARKIFNRFGTILENVTKNGGDETEIDAFVRYHWTLFSGEIVLARQSNSEYTTVYRRVKNLTKHASTDQSTESIIRWIGSYLESAVGCSEAFAKIENPRSISIDDTTINKEETNELVERLDGLNRLPVSRNFLPLLMATYNQYGVGREFYQIVILCEKLSFRVYNIAGRRTDAGRASLQRHGYWIEWAGRRNKAQRVFNDELNRLEFDGSDKAIPSTCEMIESEIGRNAPDTYFIDCLRREDLFEGSDRSDGWRGVRNKEVIRYLLYKYEKFLRESNEKASLSQIPPFSTWKEQGITIEHIHPQSSDSDGSVENYTDMLGNLVLLGPEDNSSAGDAGYDEKYNNTYASSKMQSLTELPSPEEGWTEDSIMSRTDDIIQFALLEWGNLTEAYVHIKNTPNNILGYREVAGAIREHHRSEHGFTVPSVQLSEDSVDTGEGWQRMNNCSNCGGTWARLESVEEWNAQCAGCGNRLKEPAYHFRFSEYVQDEVQGQLNRV